MSGKTAKNIIAFITVLLFLLLSLTVPVTVGADALSAGTYVPTEYRELDGLPTGEANTIIQSSDGYIWIGSYGGLIRYDGSKFVSFNERLGTSSVRVVFEDSLKRLWVGTNDRGAFSFEHDEFTKVENEVKNSFSCIRYFSEGKNGVVYAASTSGIAKISDGVMTPLSFDISNGGQFVGLAFDGNYLWALATTGSLYVFENDALLTVYNPSAFFSSGEIASVTKGNDNTVWLGSSLNKVAKITASGRPSSVSNISVRTFDTGEISTINNLTCLKDGRVLVSGFSGFGYLDASGSIHRIDTKETNDIFANDAILDYQNNIWVASSNYGVIKYTMGCFDFFRTDDELSQTATNAVCKLGGLFYVALNGLRIYDESGHSVSNDITDYLLGERIRNITSDIHGNVWFATQTRGVIRYNPASNEIRDFCTDRGIARVVYALSDGRMLLGQQNGVAIISGNSVVKTYNDTDLYSAFNAGNEDEWIPQDPNPSVLCAMELGNKLYIGTDGSGIFEIGGTGVTHLKDTFGIQGSSVLRLAPDSSNNGSFFICSGDSLYYYDGRDFSQLNNFTKNAGSFYEVYDRNGTVWMLQNAGIVAVNKRDLLSGKRAYSKTYGLSAGLSGSLNANTWNYIDENGVLYMPTRSGVSLFYFQGLGVEAPLSILNSVTMDDEYYEHPKEITVGSKVQRITVDIAMLLFTDTSEYYLGYQLVGFDENETVSTKKNISVGYTNLPGGTYTFKAYVINPETGARSNQIEMTIIKNKKLVEYVWFWIMCGVLIAGVSAGVFILINHFRIKKVREHQKELKNITEEALQTIARTIDAKDDYTKGHSLRVATYAKEIARRMGYSQADQERVFYIGLLHDIGKIGVPDGILNKKGRLDDEERKVIQTHVTMGGDILENFKALKGIADGAKYHHERFDGNGYTSGLKGEDIPEIARIIGIADSYDAMQSTRCYRPALTPEFIAGELKRCAGTQFDPKIVKYMLDMIDDGTAPVNL